MQPQTTDAHNPLSRSLTLLERGEILAEIDALDRSDRFAFTQNLFDFRTRVVARLNNRFLADLMTVLYRKFYIVSLVVDAGDDAERVARISLVLRRFWTAMACGDLQSAREVLRDDTAYWLADLPPSSGAGERPEA